MHEKNKNLLFINKLQKSSEKNDESGSLALIKLDYLIDKISLLEEFQEGPLSRSQSYATLLTLIRLVKTDTPDKPLLSLISAKAYNAGRSQETLFKINSEFSNEVSAVYLEFAKVVKSLINDKHRPEKFKRDLDNVLEKFKTLSDEYQQNLKIEAHKKFK